MIRLPISATSVPGATLALAAALGTVIAWPVTALAAGNCDPNSDKPLSDLCGGIGIDEPIQRGADGSPLLIACLFGVVLIVATALWIKSRRRV